MAESRSRLSSFTVVMIGIVLVLAGMAALGISVAAAGEHGFWLALGGAIAMVVFLTTGFVLLILAFRRRGGLLKVKPSASEVETYRDEYRG